MPNELDLSDNLFTGINVSKGIADNTKSIRVRDNKILVDTLQLKELPGALKIFDLRGNTILECVDQKGERIEDARIKYDMGNDEQREVDERSYELEYDDY